MTDMLYLLQITCTLCTSDGILVSTPRLLQIPNSAPLNPNTRRIVYSGQRSGGQKMCTYKQAGQASSCHSSVRL